MFLEQNALLRSKHPELTSTIKKSTCVLAVVLFVALNFGPFRYFSLYVLLCVIDYF